MRKLRWGGILGEIQWLVTGSRPNLVTWLKWIDLCRVKSTLPLHVEFMRSAVLDSSSKMFEMTFGFATTGSLRLICVWMLLLLRGLFVTRVFLKNVMQSWVPPMSFLETHSAAIYCRFSRFTCFFMFMVFACSHFFAAFTRFRVFVVLCVLDPWTSLDQRTARKNKKHIAMKSNGRRSNMKPWQTRHYTPCWPPTPEWCCECAHVNIKTH